MVNVIKVATELNKLEIKKGTLIDLKDINKYDESEIVLLMTGSQGEPMSALNRMAYGEHRKLVLTENDTVIISASPSRQLILHVFLNVLILHELE